MFPGQRRTHGRQEEEDSYERTVHFCEAGLCRIQHYDICIIEKYIYIYTYTGSWQRQVRPAYIYIYICIHNASCMKAGKTSEATPKKVKEPHYPLHPPPDSQPPPTPPTPFLSDQEVKKLDAQNAVAQLSAGGPEGGEEEPGFIDDECVEPVDCHDESMHQNSLLVEVQDENHSPAASAGSKAVKGQTNPDVPPVSKEGEALLTAGGQAVESEVAPLPSSPGPFAGEMDSDEEGCPKKKNKTSKGTNKAGIGFGKTGALY